MRQRAIVAGEIKIREVNNSCISGFNNCPDFFRFFSIFLDFILSTVLVTTPDTTSPLTKHKHLQSTEFEHQSSFANRSSSCT